MHQNVVEHLEFVKTLFRQRQREARSVNRQIVFFENVRQRTNVVLVAVREDNGGQVVAVLFEKVEIRYRNVDAERRFLWKTHTGVDDDHLVAVPDTHAVHPELADPAKRYDFDLFHL